MQTQPTDNDHELLALHGALKALAAEMGPKADVSFSVTSRESARWCCSAHPLGIMGKEYIYKYASTPEDALAATREEWGNRTEARAENTTRDMALAVIRITAETGACTDAQLRGSDFEQADIVRFGPQAAERAHTMAASGPFEIILTASANEAEAA